MENHQTQINQMNTNDNRLILEALLVLLEEKHELHEVTERIQNRLASGWGKMPANPDDWIPENSIGAFGEREAVQFCNKRTGSGFTAAWLASKNIPWPPPARWKRRLSAVLVEKFKMVKTRAGFVVASYLSDKLDQNP